ncbi:hypothetical protein P153DRAFT_384442 [Dothidotthia symphoricarpi CBS 119687]|uniref:Uncharacterized protein n=1 Tax=Dothidotthia symphoricarpi CBS 119687 TaxID=1392245 RepID=A0A6A6AJE6_9PLEO|nr:uncharacterized protein P153DRAFT_384442 [Dothidotthia symphoricarpi CBS 119687]KAF2131225.1 hypothetical protein P153DRAFT_384442 [Dothidotthia symphoricarpi CBS 119687]
MRFQTLTALLCATTLADKIEWDLLDVELPAESLEMPVFNYSVSANLPASVIPRVVHDLLVLQTSAVMENPRQVVAPSTKTRHAAPTSLVWHAAPTKPAAEADAAPPADPAAAEEKDAATSGRHAAVRRNAVTQTTRIVAAKFAARMIRSAAAMCAVMRDRLARLRGVV